ncbi:MAG: zinc ribbon domain-containing protein [Candidatus Firestonebacteria bacterium]
MGKIKILSVVVITTFIIGCGGTNCVTKTESTQPVTEQKHGPSLEEASAPFCQSCSMPMVKAEDFGTNADGTKNQDYCHFCYANGSFLGPNMTMEQMIDMCAKIMVEKQIMSEEQAKETLKKVMPNLKRWQVK